MTRIAVFASGTGSNAQNIIDYFKDNQHIKVALVVCNKKNAKVIRMARERQVPVAIISNKQLRDNKGILNLLAKYQINNIVLAGFLSLIPKYLINKYSNKIINIHPSLLPKYGGKGMYGNNVHQAVLDNKEKETGITIHLVNEAFDEGKIIAQFSVNITEVDSLESIQQKVRTLEMNHFPKVIENWVS